MSKNIELVFFWWFLILFLISMIVKINTIDIYFLDSYIVYIIFIISIIYFGKQTIDKTHEITTYKNNFNYTLSILFILCLLTIIVNIIYHQITVDYTFFYYNEFIKFGNWLKSIQQWITIFAAILLILLFYSNKDNISSIEQDQKLEQVEETNTIKNFNFDYNLISRIPLINKFSKYILKEGWINLFYLYCIVIIWGIARIINVSYWPYLRDEYNTLMEAKINFFTWDFIHLQLFHLINIQTFLYDYFGFTTDIFINKIPYILFWIINIILIYYISKKLFNKKIALISSMLFSFSLYSINMSNYIREYEFNLMIMNIFILFIVNTTNLKKIIIISLFYWIVFFFSMPIITWWTNTFISSIFIIPPLILGKLLLLSDIWNKIKTKHILFFLLITLPICFIIYINYLSRLFNIQIDFRWYEYMFYGSLDMGDSLQTLLLIIWLYFFIVNWIHKKNKSLLIIFWIILLSIIYYNFVFGRYFAPRYIYYYFPIYIYIFSIGIYYLYKILGKKVFSLLLLSIFVIQYNNYSIFYSNIPNFHKYIGTYAYDNIQLIKEIDKIWINVDKDTIITTNSWDLWFYKMNIDKSTCFKTINIKHNYQLPCNFYTIEDFFNWDVEIKNYAYIITDWKRKPFWEEKIKHKELIITRIFNWSFKIYKVEKE